MKKNATHNFNTTTEVVSVTKNLVLEGVKTLRAEKVTTTFEVTREVHPKSNKPFRLISKKLISEQVEPLSFSLVEIDLETLASYRRNNVSSFVLKFDGKLYYTAIPDNINFVSSMILGAHQCAVAGHECRRLSAASDELGGCAKVRNRSKHIERYPWITTGYETFNTKHDWFVVTKCLHYEKCPPRKKFSTTELQKNRLALAQFLWDDVRSRKDVAKRVRKNRN